MSDIDRLVHDLEGFRARPAAKAALLKIGDPAVPALVEVLHHPNEGVRWVAARTLGEIGSAEAEGPLREAAKQIGMEIVCSDALDQISKKTGVAQKGGGRGVEGQAHDPLTIIRGALSAAHFAVSDAKEGLEVKVSLPSGRTQRVAVGLHLVDSEDREYIQFRTECGPSRSDGYEWALKQNAKQPIATIGIVDSNPPTFVMTRNVYRDSLHADEVLRIVTALAANGDVFEKALTKEDRR